MAASRASRARTGPVARPETSAAPSAAGRAASSEPDYSKASRALKAKGWVWNVSTGFYERDGERVTLSPRDGRYVVKRWSRAAQAAL
jgi:hypothetical protein